MIPQLKPTENILLNRKQNEMIRVILFTLTLLAIVATALWAANTTGWLQ